jgi:hypothetical protein
MNDAALSANAPAPRLDTLANKTIALLDITKPGGSIFLDRIEHLLKTRYHVSQIIRDTKPTYTKPAPPAVLERLRTVDAVIEALAD